MQIKHKVKEISDGIIKNVLGEANVKLFNRKEADHDEKFKTSTTNDEKYQILTSTFLVDCDKNRG